MTAPALQVQIQGQTVVSADNLNSYELTCDNVSQLRGFIGTAGVQVYMRGFTSPGDGGQGVFYWNTAGTGPDDGGVTNIVPNGINVGCWTRIPSIKLSPSTVNNAAGVALTSANVCNGVLNRMGANAVTDTFPSASSIISTLNGFGITSLAYLLVVNQNK